MLEAEGDDSACGLSRVALPPAFHRDPKSQLRLRMLTIDISEANRSDQIPLTLQLYCKHYDLPLGVKLGSADDPLQRLLFGIRVRD